jgi:hypothetical protein
MKTLRNIEVNSNKFNIDRICKKNNYERFENFKAVNVKYIAILWVVTAGTFVDRHQEKLTAFMFRVLQSMFWLFKMWCVHLCVVRDWHFLSAQWAVGFITFACTPVVVIQDQSFVPQSVISSQLLTAAVAVCTDKVLETETSEHRRRLSL